MNEDVKTICITTRDMDYEGLFKWFVVDIPCKKYECTAVAYHKHNHLALDKRFKKSKLKHCLAQTYPAYCQFAAIGSTLYWCGGCITPKKFRVTKGENGKDFITRLVDDEFASEFRFVNINSNVWRKDSSLVCPRQSPVLVVVDGKLYLFGGSFGGWGAIC
ncbi:hypothetical protein O6P43_029245 [Quillaja saponaria]|uniref:Uncharacterized protein n=1 Tax=Quillaja saponaria TaxID=32244 RepID=A0AAD7KZR0_QUISA|nr:hypothetical protein O6P43_029245 [Quillaja saponaria]